MESLTKIVEAANRAVENIKSGMTNDDACNLLMQEVEPILLSFKLPEETESCPQVPKSGHTSKGNPPSEIS